MKKNDNYCYMPYAINPSTLSDFLLHMPEPEKNPGPEHYEDRRQSIQIDEETIRKLEFNNLILLAQLEGSLDGILVEDANRRILCFNQKFIDMWKIPYVILWSSSPDERITFLADKLQPTEAVDFREEVSALAVAPGQSFQKEITLKTGLVFNVTSIPVKKQKDTESIKGRIWFYTDLTELKQAEEMLQNQKMRLEQFIFQRTIELEKLYQNLQLKRQETERQCEELEKKKESLQAILYAKENEKKQLESEIKSRFNKSILPFIDFLAETKLTRRQKQIVTELKNILDEITSGMNHELQLLKSQLTPTELQIANCIKSGKTSKEIAEFLCCSERTIEGHRLAIRRKVKIKKGENLRCHLHRLSLSGKCDAK